MAAESAKPSDKPRLERWLESLLDPSTIHYLLGLGGGLCVLGVVVWLASLGVFENARVLGGSLIAGNTAVLAAGVLLAARTRYRTAGNAVAFLACVLAPLNLWFLHAQGLITVADHLWIGGVVCSVVFAGVVRLLRQPVHVYAVEIGVTLTALLFLADLNRAADPVYLAVAGVALAAASIQIIRAFPPEGEFSRSRFFMPLFISGQVQLAVGLLVLAASQLFGGWPVLGRYGLEWLGGGFDRSPWLSALVWSAGAVLYVSSHRLLPRGRAFASAAMLCAVFAALSIVNPYLGVDGRIVAYAVCSAVLAVRSREQNGERSLRELGVAAGLAFGFMACIAVVLRVTGSAWYADLPIDWPLLAAAVVAAASQLFATRHVQAESRTAMVVQSIMAGAMMTAAVEVARTLFWPAMIPAALGAAMVAPATLLAAALVVASQSWKRPLAIASLVAAVVAVGTGFNDPAVIGAVLHPGAGAPQTPYLALIAAQFALVAAGALTVRKHPVLMAACGLSVFGALWLGLGWLGVPTAYFASMVAGLGLISVVIGQRALGESALRSALVAVGRGLLVVAGLAALFQTIPLAFNAGHWADVGGFALVALICGVAGVADAERDWRRVFRSIAVLCAIGALFDVNALVALPTWRKAEFIAAFVGLAAIAIGYTESFANRENPKEAPGYMGLAAALAALPVLAGAFYFRFAVGRPSLPEEFAALTAAIVLSATGLGWRFKAPTIVGLGSLAVYLAVMIGQLAYHPQVAVGVYLAVGGGMLFIAAAFLAAYRETILALPDAIERRQGIFQILDWR